MSSLVTQPAPASSADRSRSAAATGEERRERDIGYLPRGEEEVSPAVLLPAVFGLRGAERPFLAVGDGPDPRAVDSERGQVLASRVGAPVAEREVVLRRAAVVAMTLDQELRARMGLEPIRIGGERSACIVAQVRLVVVEERVL